MSSLNIHLKNLNKQHGGSGIPFSEFMKQKKKTKRKTTVRKKSSRSPSRKRKVTRRTKKRIVSRKSNKKRCKCGSHTYTGKENTPRGLGKCEECIPLNVIMKGKDGHLYEYKNHHWIQFNEL